MTAGRGGGAALGSATVIKLARAAGRARAAAKVGSGRAALQVVSKIPCFSVRNKVFLREQRCRYFQNSRLFTEK